MFGFLSGLGASVTGSGLPGVGSLGGQPGISTSGPAIAEGDTINVTQGGGGVFGAFDDLARREPYAAAVVVVAVVIAGAMVLQSIFGKGD